MQLVKHSLFECGRAGIGKPCQETGVEAKGNNGDAGENRGTQTLANTLADAERLLHAGKNPAAYEKGNGKRCCCTCGIGGEQKRRLEISAI